jgi:hypothetical protein
MLLSTCHLLACPPFRTHLPPSTPARTLPKPSEGCRAAKDSSLFVFISHPAWLSLNCPMAVPLAPQTQVPTALGPTLQLISGRSDRRARASGGHQGDHAKSLPVPRRALCE